MPPFRSFLEDPLALSGLSRLDFAAEVYRNRNLPPEKRKDRDWQRKHPYQPVGYQLKRGLKPMFVPHPLEVRPCCWAIATPIMDYPHGWHRHCRTLRHVAALLNVDERELREKCLPPRARCLLKCGRFAKKGASYCGTCAFIHRLDAPK